MLKVSWLFLSLHKFLPYRPVRTPPVGVTGFWSLELLSAAAEDRIKENSLGSLGDPAVSAQHSDVDGKAVHDPRNLGTQWEKELCMTHFGVSRARPLKARVGTRKKYKVFFVLDNPPPLLQKWQKSVTGDRRIPEPLKDRAWGPTSGPLITIATTLGVISTSLMDKSVSHCYFNLCVFPRDQPLQTASSQDLQSPCELSLITSPSNWLRNHHSFLADFWKTSRSACLWVFVFVVPLSDMLFP